METFQYIYIFGRFPDYTGYPNSYTFPGLNPSATTTTSTTGWGGGGGGGGGGDGAGANSEWPDNHVKSFCLPPEGQEEVNLLVVGVGVVIGIISFFFH